MKNIACVNHTLNKIGHKVRSYMTLVKKTWGLKWTLILGRREFIFIRLVELRAIGAHGKDLLATRNQFSFELWNKHLKIVVDFGV